MIVERYSEPVELLIIPDNIIDLIDGQKFKNHGFNFQVDEYGRTVLDKSYVDNLAYAPYTAFFLQMKKETARIDNEATAGSTYSYRILELAYAGSSYKDHRAIDYTIEVQKLHAKREWSIEGFLTNVIWYEEPEYINEVLRVEVVYTTDQNELIPAAQSVISRVTTRKWKATDGTYPESGWKITEKHYQTTAEKRTEGIRRRSNIITQLGDGLGYQLMTAGDTQAQAEDKISQLMVKHSNALSVYREGGKGTIYDDVQNDTTTTWLTQSLKDYTINKLQGLA